MPDHTASDRQQPRLVDISQLIECHHPWIGTPAAARGLVARAKPRLNAGGEVCEGNGLAHAIVKVGDRVLFDLDRFNAWLESRRLSNVLQAKRARSAHRRPAQATQEVA
ncbi:hypothetical protein [Roseicella aerolata]|uniref:Uncharacterized protein n=1 Tax=Roseicella aerolata TaxID=2883479 RepID=A0A9X1IC26_9PROT|nr:hypothetical protein [Roseicella aerolata]MCB4821174.1 hypothetical protein [Roseicella aerolata]